MLEKMSSPLHIYTICFTLAGNCAKENVYIDMLLIWLTYLLKNGGLTKEDTISICIDQETQSVLQQDEYISYLTNSPLAPTIKFLRVPTPTSLSRGMMLKYSIYEYIQSSFTLYLDVDILVVRPIRDRFQPPGPNTIRVFPEGKMSDASFSGDLWDFSESGANHRITPLHCGFSAGIFMFSGGEGVKGLFMAILHKTELNESKPHFTLDQPFLNQILWQNFEKENVPYTLDIVTTMEHIGKGLQRDSLCTFLNFCGFPGDGMMHYRKMIRAACLDLFLQGPAAGAVYQ